MQHPKPVWILTTGRSGSNYLSAMLNNTGLFSFTECMHENNGPFRFIGCINCKALRRQFIRSLHDGARDEINLSLPGIKYILLNRKDIKSKAISHYFAHITGVWKVHQGELEDYFKLPIYLDKDLLKACYDEELSYLNCWDNYLRDTPHFRVEYEDMINNPVETIIKIFDYIEIKITPEEAQAAVDKCDGVVMTRPEFQEYLEELEKLI